MASGTVALAGTVTCVLACGALVVAEARGHRPGQAITKTLASLGFVAVGLAVAVSAPHATWFIAGLILGLAGDVALLGHGERAFLAGLGAFLLGHLAYVVGLARLVSPERWITDAGAVALIPIAGGVLALAWLWPHLGRMRVPVIVYVLAIVAMVIGATAAARGTPLPAARRMELVAGAALFFVSDLSVARDRFVVRSFANRAWGLPAYYAGQLLIAWSLAA